MSRRLILNHAYFLSEFTCAQVTYQLAVTVKNILNKISFNSENKCALEMS